MIKHITDYLKVHELKHGYLYKIHARNASIGIWNENTKDFTISRWKFSMNYLFEEIHWDMSKDFGTVKAIEEIEKTPFTTLKEDGILEYLNEKGRCEEND